MPLVIPPTPPLAPIAKISELDFKEPTPTAGYRGRGFFSGNYDRKWLLRHATVSERLQIRDKVSDEEDGKSLFKDQSWISSSRCTPLTPTLLKYPFSPTHSNR